MRVMVFGAARHVGAHVVVALAEAGHEAVGVDLPLNREVNDGLDAESKPQSGDSTITWLDPAAPHFDLTGVDAVAFCGIDGYPLAAKTPVTDAALAAERSVLDSLLASGPRVLVLESSAAVYAESPNTVLGEDAPVAATSRMGAHCLALEAAVGDAVARGDLSAVVLRCGLIAGAQPGVFQRRRASKAPYLYPGIEDAAGLFPLVKMRLGGAAELLDGQNISDVVHVRDVARSVVRAVEAGSASGGGLLVYNVGRGSRPDTVAALPAAEEVYNLEIELTGDWHVEALPSAVLSVEAIQRDLGWEAVVPLEVIVNEEASLLRRETLSRRSVSSSMRLVHEFLGSRVHDGHFELFGILGVLDRSAIYMPENARFEIAQQVYTPEFLWAGRRGRGRTLTVRPYRLRIPMEDVNEFPIQNVVRLLYVAPDGTWFRRRLRYSVLRGLFKYGHGRLHHLPQTGSTLYVRQAARNLLYLSMRTRLATDRLAMAPRIFAAWAASLVYKKRVTLLYEKQASRYEESASVVYEAMRDRGEPTAYYVLDQAAIDDVPERYRDRVVRRFSLRHFYYYFCARTLVGTEAPAHVAELRTANRLLLSRLHGGKYAFVFLGHGVTYMVALSSRLRSAFQAGNSIFPPRSRIAVCSKLEARHFIELGGFRPENLYICGIPKFDRAVRDEGADLILIMPTWRAWEYNAIRSDATQTPYFKMLVELYEAVPPELREKAYIMPHPLMAPAIEESALSDRMWRGESYDAALRRCDILITDYSSIAYDAFYRGANVIFWWKEKEYCMEQYGGHLMIDEDTAPGPVCYDAEALSRTIAACRLTPQDGEYVRRYRQIVEFNDNRNTDRLLEMMQRDGFI